MKSPTPSHSHKSHAKKVAAPTHPELAIGQIVDYLQPGHGLVPVVAAVVTGLHSDGVIDLTAFPPRSMPEPKMRVPHGPSETNPEAPYWEWAGETPLTDEQTIERIAP